MGAYRDFQLLQDTLKVKQKFDSTIFIETGTNDGDSVTLLAEFFQKLYSVEIKPEIYEAALLNTWRYTNIKLFNGNSVDVLDELCGSIKEKNEIIFFLDAHWYDYWPILDELAVIKKHNIIAPVIIHDFFVPNEDGTPKFNFDEYNGIKLDFPYIKQKVDELYGESNYDIHYPTPFNEKGEIIQKSEGSGYIIITPK